MGVQGETASTNPCTKEAAVGVVLCEECKLNPFKYKCPGCLIRSCSLPCVRAHKRRTACTGKRQQHTDFVPLSRFDDNLLLSDYNMLEDVKRVAESARRMKTKLGGTSHFWLPFPLKSLRNAAASRSTKLSFLPNGMSKRRANQSYYNNRKKFISWTIEWRFHSTDVVIVDHRINENRNVCSVIQSHLRPGPWTHRLRQFCEEPLDSLKFFIRKYYKGPKSPFRKLDINSPIRQQLANLFILEYPVIHVFLPSHSFDFEIIKDAITQKPALKEPITDAPSPKGVIFREEEIEDNDLADPQVLDLKKRLHPEVLLKTTLGNKSNMPSKEAAAKEGKLVVKIVQNAQNNDNMLPSGSNIEDIGLVEGMDFDFEQDLIDEYADLIAQHNPDEFLDLHGVFLEETRNCSDFGVVEEELEEGEIAAS